MSHPAVQFLWILLLVTLACAKVTVQGEACRKYVHTRKATMLFNTLFFAVILLFLLAVFRPTHYMWQTVVFGAITGFTSMAFQFTYSIALVTGPVSLTVLINNFSVLITTLFSVLYYKETFGVFQIVGIVFLVASMLFTNLKKKEEQKGSGMWLFLCLLTMVAGASGSCVQKVYSVTYASQGGDSSVSLLVMMYLFAMAMALVAFFVLPEHGEKQKDGTVLTPTGHTQLTGWRFALRVLPYLLILGVVMAAYQKCNMVGLAEISGIFMFPTFSALQILLMTLIGVIRFRDRLSGRQWIGVACGIVSVCLMNIRIA